ncbi:hypothetical protein [Ancylobacter sp. G4_0304]
MWFLALELWPYLIGALAIGVVTGWLGGCKPASRVAPAKDDAREAAR